MVAGGADAPVTARSASSIWSLIATAPRCSASPRHRGRRRERRQRAVAAFQRHRLGCRCIRADRGAPVCWLRHVNQFQVDTAIIRSSSTTRCSQAATAHVLARVVTAAARGRHRSKQRRAAQRPARFQLTDRSLCSHRRGRGTAGCIRRLHWQQRRVSPTLRRNKLVDLAAGPVRKRDLCSFDLEVDAKRSAGVDGFRPPTHRSRVPIVFRRQPRGTEPRRRRGWRLRVLLTRNLRPALRSDAKAQCGGRLHRVGHDKLRHLNRWCRGTRFDGASGDRGRISGGLTDYVSNVDSMGFEMVGAMRC